MNNMNRNILSKTIVVFVFTVLFSTVLFAQKSSSSATIKPSEIFIGEQALLNIQVTTQKDRKISFPKYDKEIVPGLEVVGTLSPDTIIKDNTMTINYKYILTSFDSTLYNVSAVPTYDGIDTILSNATQIKVKYPELKDSTKMYLEKMKSSQGDSVDFEKLQLYDIKPIKEAPFVWSDYLWILWIILLVIFLCAIIYYIILLLRKRKKGYYFKPEENIPPDIKAIRALDKLKEEKIWQQGREKEFYTQITDILRIYIYERYAINALEMTSFEILSMLKEKTDIKVNSHLQYILSIADFVKFAKYKPYQDENDNSISNAYTFVNETKEIEQKTEEISEVKEDTKENNQE